jgi:hypothetical protein
MEAGHYIGKDGRERRWTRDRRVVRLEVNVGEKWSLVDAVLGMDDLDAAKAALDALLAEPEWVEWTNLDGSIKLRGLADGSLIEQQSVVDGQWYEATGCIHGTYRAGRATGLEDGRKEARELAEAVMAHRGTEAMEPYSWSVMGASVVAVSRDGWKSIVALSRKVLGR